MQMMSFGICSFRPQLCTHESFITRGARFLHSKLLYNNIKFVTGGQNKQWWGRNRIDPNF